MGVKKALSLRISSVQQLIPCEPAGVEMTLDSSDFFSPGEMRTVAGNGTEPLRNVDEWEADPLTGVREERCGDGWKAAVPKSSNVTKHPQKAS